MLTIWEHLKFIGLTYNLKDWENWAENFLGCFDLFVKRDELGSILFNGMKQKTMIYCALLHEPDVILFDKPLVGLDPRAVR